MFLDQNPDTFQLFPQEKALTELLENNLKKVKERILLCTSEQLFQEFIASLQKEYEIELVILQKDK